MKERFLLVFALLTLPGADGFYCYVCSGCNDPFVPESSLKYDCAISQCMKTKTESGVVERSCATQKSGIPKCEKTHGVELCLCDDELCNGSPVTGSSLKMLLLLAAGVIMLIRLSL